MDALFDGLYNRCEQQIACPADSTAKDDFLRTNDSQNVSYRDPQIHPDSLQDSVCDRVSLSCRPGDDFRVDPVQVMIDQLADPCGVPMHHFLDTHGGDGWTGGVKFQASLSTTTAG